MNGDQDDDLPDLAPEELEPENGDALELEPLDETAESAAFAHIAPPDRRLITQPYDLAVSDLVNQIEAARLHLRPVYQRRYVWDNKKASKLVESLLINVPIPVCYLAEETDGTRSVIDGQQRLRSLYRFLENQFPLSGLDVLPEINRKRFHQLTGRQQRLIGNRTIRCIVISEDSDPDIRFDVFERLNTGSVALTAQELRNSVYRGPLNDLLRGVAEDERFRRCLNHRTDTRMAFEELALRFFALHERLEAYRPSLKHFLNDFMRDHRHLGEADVATRREAFLTTCDRAYALFGGSCFRRATGTPKRWEWFPSINSALYDVVTLNLAELDSTPEDLERRADEVQQALVNLMLTSEEFADAISRATGDRARLHRRVRMFAESLAELGLISGLETTLSE